ncbi:hypothetical protein FB107DRAFT_198439 [Schizophyllum commune]
MHDLLCALCSAPFATLEYTGPPEFDDSDTALSLGEGYDSYQRWSSLSANKWLKHLRAIGVNSALTGAKRCYISGIGSNTDSSSICVEPGDHPNTPASVGGSNDPVNLDAYCCWKSTRNGKGVFPVHINCLDILKMVFQQEGLDLDADILYESFRNALLTYSFGNQFDDSYFDFEIVSDYNDMVTFVPQLEESEVGPFVSDPVDICGLTEYLKNPPIINAHGSAPSRHAERASRAQDPFASLPCELLLMIMLLIPKDSLQPFFLASPSARSIWLPNTFFRARLAVDIPWAWEVIEGPLFERTDVDWRRVYTHLRKEADREWTDDMPGLANRRRIWDICVCGKPAATYRRLAAKAETASATNAA